MEVTGKDFLLTSNAQKLFLVGREWIEEHWKAKNREISSIAIKPKLIDRNEGFRMVVSLIDPCDEVLYYVKIQSPHVDTVIMHHLLKFTNCGPDEFLTVLLDPADGWHYVPKHGVITREIADWRMAFTWLVEEKLKLSEHAYLKCNSFLLTIMIQLGQFGNIPNNRDNWGLVRTHEALSGESHEPSLKLVDYSAGGFSSALSSSREDFWANWYFQHANSFNPSYLTISNKTENLTNWVLGSPIEAQISHFPWLQSQAAFLEMMEKVCVSTEAWLQEVLSKASSEPNTDIEKTAPSSPLGVSVAGVTLSDGASRPLLQAYKHTARPDTSNCDATMREMVMEYVSWVEEWDRQVKLMCTWFPFPQGEMSIELGEKSK